MVTAEAGEPIPKLARAVLPEEGFADGAFTWLGAGLDAAILAGMQVVIDAMLLPDPAELPALRAAAARLDTPALRGDPASFFEFSSDSFATETVAASSAGARGDGGVTRRELSTAYVPREGESPPPPGDAIRLEHWQHPAERRRGTVLALHGFTMGYPRIDAPVLFASNFFAAGLDVALMTLPQHGARTPSEARFSGERFAVPNAIDFAHGVRRAVHEIRSTVLWLRETTGDPVGVLGLSLGGYLTALSAGLYDDLDFAIALVPPVCIGDLAWRFQGRSLRRGRPSFDYDELRRNYRLHSPLAHPLRTERERVMIVAGRGDRIVPAEHPHALWEHWGRPTLHWYSGGHLAPFGRSAVARAMLRHVQDLGIL